jgi:hypothetical protein
MIIWDVQMKEMKLVSKPFPWVWHYSSDDCWHSSWSSRLLCHTTTCFRLLIGSPFFRPLIRFPVLTTIFNYLKRLPVKIKYSEVTVMRIKNRIRKTDIYITCCNVKQYVIFWSWEFILNIRVIRTATKHLVFCLASHRPCSLWVLIIPSTTITL